MEHFTFIYRQTIATAHPNFEVEVTFTVEAEIEPSEETVNILRITGYSAFADQTTQASPLPIRNEDTQAAAMFLGKLREAGRRVYYEAINGKNKVHPIKA